MSEHRKLTRSSERMIGGVCSGLARYLNLDPVLVRLVFIALALVNGLGVLIYLIMWLLVPDEAAGPQSGDDVIRANLEDIGNQARRIGERIGRSEGSAFLFGVLLIVLGGLFLLRNFVPGIDMSLMWPLLLIALGGYLLLKHH